MLNLNRSELKFVELLLEINLKILLINNQEFDKYLLSEYLENKKILKKVKLALEN